MRGGVPFGALVWARVALMGPSCEPARSADSGPRDQPGVGGREDDPRSPAGVCDQTTLRRPQTLELSATDASRPKQARASVQRELLADRRARARGRPRLPRSGPPGRRPGRRTAGGGSCRSGSAPPRRASRIAAAVAACSGSRTAGWGECGVRCGNWQTAPLTGRNAASNGPLSHPDPPPVAVEERVAAVDDPAAVGLDDPGDLGVAEAVDRGHGGDGERAGADGLPRRDDGPADRLLRGRGGDLEERRRRWPPGAGRAARRAATSGSAWSRCRWVTSATSAGPDGGGSSVQRRPDELLQVAEARERVDHEPLPVGLDLDAGPAQSC